MNKKQGFTLAELLGVIIIVGIIALLIIPAIDNSVTDSKDNLYRAQINNIEKAAENWAAYNMMKLPENEDDYIIVYLWELKYDGYVDDDISDPRNGKLFPNDMEIKVTLKNKKYVYELIEGSGTEGNTDIPGSRAIVKFSVVGSPFNKDGWASNDFEVNIVAENPNGEDISNIKWCNTIESICEPSTVISGSSGNAVVSVDGDSSKICAIATDNSGLKSLKMCSDIYKIDKQGPVISAKNSSVTVYQGTNKNISSYFSISKNGYADILKTTCVNESSNSEEVSSVSDLLVGNNVVTCTVHKANGMTASASVTFTVNGAVARIGDTTYPTLNSAINAVTTASPTTIVMLKDVELTARETIGSTQNITLDLDGHTIDANFSNNLFLVNGTLTFDSSKGGTINHSSSSVTVSISRTGTVNVNNGVFNSSSYVFYLNGGGYLNISGGEMLASSSSTLYNSGGTIVHTGGSVKSTNYNALYNSSGSYEMNGDTALLEADVSNTIVNKGNVTINKGGVKSNSTSSDNYLLFYNYEAGNVVINNGYFESNLGSHLYNLGTVTINGGTFVNEKSGNYFASNQGNKNLTINGGVFSGNTRIINGSSSAATDIGNLYINGGYFKLYDQTNAIQQFSAGEMIIKNAKIETFDTESVSYPMIWIDTDTDNVTIESGTEIISKTRNHIYNKGTGDITIDGGTFVNESKVTIDNFNSGTIYINDGIFSSSYDIVQNYGNGGRVLVNGGDYTLVAESGSDVFQNGATNYPDNKSTIEINGGTYHLENAGIAYNVTTGDVIVSNIVYDETGVSGNGASYIFANGHLKDYSSNMTVNNSQIKTKNGLIFGNYSAGNLTINGGDYEVNNSSFVYNKNSGNVEINSDIHVVSNTPRDVDPQTGILFWTSIVYNGDDVTGAGTITINGGNYESTTTGFGSNHGSGIIIVNDANVVINIAEDANQEYRTQIFNCEHSSTTIINGGYFDNYYGSVFTLSNNSTIGNEATANTKLIIGDGTKTISSSSPKMISRFDTFSVISYDIGSVTFNNGIIVGNRSYDSGLNLITRSGATLTNGTENIDGVSYKTLYYR